MAKKQRVRMTATAPQNKKAQQQNKPRRVRGADTESPTARTNVLAGPALTGEEAQLLIRSYMAGKPCLGRMIFNDAGTLYMEVYDIGKERYYGVIHSDSAAMIAPSANIALNKLVPVDKPEETLSVRCHKYYLQKSIERSEKRGRVRVMNEDGTVPQTSLPPRDTRIGKAATRRKRVRV